MYFAKDHFDKNNSFLSTPQIDDSNAGIEDLIGIPFQ